MQRTPFLVAAAFATALMAHAGEMPDFSGIDSDADGKISEAEFVSWKTSGGKSTEAEATAKFTKFDKDGDGWIIEAEYNAAIDAWRTHPADMNPGTGGNTN
ncbi:MAG: hypothetical protein R3C08_00925 [Hyphomonas sp.]|nr:hypothetical protein [Hyphomonas sp.]HRX73494.1 hypothetical protein [Hyphomonas sp.]